MTESILWSAAQAADAIGVETSTFHRMMREGRIPPCVEHRSTFGQGRCRRYSRFLLELWAAGVDVEQLTQLDLAELLNARKAAAAGMAPPRRPGARELGETQEKAS